MNVSHNTITAGATQWARPLGHEQAKYRVDRIAAFEAWLGACLTVMAVLLCTSSFYYLFVEGGREGATQAKSAASNPIYMLLWISFYGLAAIGFVWTILRQGLQTSFLAGLPVVILVLGSALWSVNVKTTLFYGLMFLMNVVAGYALARLVHPTRFLRLVAQTLWFCLIASIVLAVTNPEISLSQRWGGGWIGGMQLRGVFAHKSDAGYYFALLGILMVGGRALGFGTAWQVVTGLTLAVVMPLTNSATGTVALVTLAGLVVMATRYQRLQTSALAIVAFVFVAFSILLPFVDLGRIPELVGRDAALTGRGPIWEHGRAIIGESPLLGFGYYGFFDTSTFSPVWQLWGNFQYFFTPHMHNSGLDVLSSFGVVGLAVYAAMLALAFGVITNRSIAAPTRALLAAALLLFTISAAFDYTFFKHNSLASLLLMYAVFAAQTRYR